MSRTSAAHAAGDQFTIRQQARRLDRLDEWAVPSGGARMSVERVELPQRVSQAVTIDHLSVERRRLLLGIDISRPRFAWRLEGMGDGARQTAYQLQVLDTGDPRASWVAPMWDTGRCAAGASTYVPYTGPTLQSRHRYSWRARIWGGAGAPTHRGA